MLLNSKIFRAYDIRGEAFVDFDEDGFMAIAHGFGEYLKEKHNILEPNVFVSGDGRQSMPELYPAVISGLKAAGCTITWGGTIPTPVNYFAFHHGDFDAAIQISASHNPAGDNGLKMCDRTGAVSGDEIQKIRALAECSDCRINNSTGECSNACTESDFFADYLTKISNITPTQQPLKIIVDAGNAVPGIFYPNALSQFGHEVTEMYCDLDTTFPNHQPDPERPENLVDLQKGIQSESADLGFAFDGDGDRVGVVLEDGTILNADKILYCLASDFLTRNPNAPIVLDAMSSQTLIDKLKEKGAEIILSKTGHSHIEHAMHDHNALLGGEQSGHFMFGENFYGHDDALLATLRFIQSIEHNPELIAEVTTQWPKMLEISDRITVPDETKFQIIENAATALKREFPDASTLDGVRINFGKSEWAIVRASNTSPKIAVRIEAKDQESLESKQQTIMSKLQGLLS